MAIHFKGKDYEAEEILKLPDEEKRAAIEQFHRKLNGEDDRNLNAMLDKFRTNERNAKPEDEKVTNIRMVQSIKNPLAIRMYYQMMANGSNDAHVINHIKGLFDVEDEMYDMYKKLYDELDKQSGYPKGLRGWLVGYCLAFGVGIEEAIGKVNKLQIAAMKEDSNIE